MFCIQISCADLLPTFFSGDEPSVDGFQRTFEINDVLVFVSQS